MKSKFKIEHGNRWRDVAFSRSYQKRGGWNRLLRVLQADWMFVLDTPNGYDVINLLTYERS